MDSARTWSHQQLAIYRWFAKDQAYFDALGLEVAIDVNGNLIVVARAGCGKTTTILEAINYAPEQSIALCAFNSRIAKELSERLNNPRAIAKTLHGIGYSFVYAYLGKTNVDARFRGDALTDQVVGMNAPIKVKRHITKLHTLAREVTPLATDVDTIIDLADNHDLLAEDEWINMGFDDNLIGEFVIDIMEYASKKEPERGTIDYADMIFLPVRNKWLRPKFDLVVVDETQDMNNSQLLIVQGICKGRTVVVGDDRQAIYGFRGADSGSMDRLKKELRAGELGLTTTYRCGKSIVRQNAQLVPDFMAGPNNPEGLVRQVPGANQMLKEVAYGDFVLSRKNAPIASLAMALIRDNKRVAVAGRDIGAGLIKLVDQLCTGKAVNSIPEFLAKLAAWQDKEINRLTRARKEEKIDAVVDKAETLFVLTEGVVGVAELKARLEGLFTDIGDPATRVTLSSVHKAKGLEADRVYVLMETLYPKLPKGVKLSEAARIARQREESNIEYVALSRAKNELVYVGQRPGGPLLPFQTVPTTEHALIGGVPAYPNEDAAGANLGPTHQEPDIHEIHRFEDEGGPAPIEKEEVPQ